MIEEQQEVKRKGRTPKSLADNSKNTLCVINDPLMSPFSIEKDNNNYIVIKTSITTRGFGGKEGGGKEKVENIGYYTSFQNALNCIAKEKFYLNKGEYSSIKEYISVWKELRDGLDELMNKIGF
jgi:hypothetical protein